MSRLQELIQKLCPDGVEFKRLGQICEIIIGEFVHKNEQTDRGKFPVYNGGKDYTGFYNNYNNTGNKVIISARGANAGFVNRVYTNYWAGNSCYSLSPLDTQQLYWMFLYYILKNKEKEFMDAQQKGSIPALSKKQIELIEIPIPPSFGTGRDCPYIGCIHLLCSGAASGAASEKGTICVLPGSIAHIRRTCRRCRVEKIGGNRNIHER